MELLPDDRRRWAKLIEWLKEEKKLNNTQLGEILSCANSSISVWINQKRMKLHNHVIEKMSNYLAITKDDLSEIIKKDANISISQRIELMRSARRNELLPPLTITGIEEILENLCYVPTWELPRVIYAAVERLNNSLTRDLVMLSQSERIQISKLTLISVNQRKVLGGTHEEKIESLLQETAFIGQILSAKGDDFLLLASGGYCSVEESVQRALIALCYQATWKNGDPILKDPLCEYQTFEELLKGLAREGSRKNCCQK
jgi:hypothetical protein